MSHPNRTPAGSVRSVRSATEVFYPQFGPRNKYDLRLTLAAFVVLTPITVLLAAAWMGLPAALIYAVTGSSALSLVGFWLMWLAWMLGFTLYPIQRLIFREEGLGIGRVGWTQYIPWNEIEAVEEVSRADVARMMFKPELWNGRTGCPGSCTFSDYILIRYNGRAILFPPKNKRVFLAALHARLHPRSVTDAVRVPSLQESNTLETEWTDFEESWAALERQAIAPSPENQAAPAAQAAQAAQAVESAPPPTVAGPPAAEESRWYWASQALREEIQQPLHRQIK